MNDFQTILNAPIEPTLFTNQELYYLISSVLELGGFDEHCIEKEKLYVQATYKDSVQFIFISTLPIISDEQEAPHTTLYFGTITDYLDDVEVYKIDVPYSALSAEYDLSKLDLDLSTFMTLAQRKHIKPISFAVETYNLLRFGFQDRIENESFFLNSAITLPENRAIKVKHVIQDDITNNPIDFSGIYYLVVEPLARFDEGDIRGVKIYSDSIADETQSKFNHTSKNFTNDDMKRFIDSIKKYA